MRRFLVAGNWKMHGSSEMVSELISEVSRQVLDNASLSEQRQLAYDILVCPPAPFLNQAVSVSDSLPIVVGGQNVSQYADGAYTGEMSLPMLEELGCKYVLLGHSERRELFGETDQNIAEKFAACVKGDSGLTPILCVGETLSQRQSGETELIVGQQLDAVIEKVGAVGFDDAVIAYEPIWAIGTGETASPEQAQEVHAFIRDKISKVNADVADDMQILYGGSVKPSNAEALFAQPDIDGGLVGGASLDADSFASICEAAHKLAT